MIRYSPLLGLLLFCCVTVLSQEIPVAQRDPNRVIISLTQTMPVGGEFWHGFLDCLPSLDFHGTKLA